MYYVLGSRFWQKKIEEMNKPTEKGLPKTNIQVFNPGSSGLQVVQNSMPLDEGDQIHHRSVKCTLHVTERESFSLAPSEIVALWETVYVALW